MKTKKIDYEKLTSVGRDTAIACSNEISINNLLLANVIPNSDNVLRKIISNFDRETDIPLEMVTFFCLSFIAGFLLQNRARLTKGSQYIYPDLWTIILASSGKSKTFSSSIIRDASGIIPNFSGGIVSGKAFLFELQENNFGFMFRDEINQLLKGIEDNPQYADLRDYLLQSYDGIMIDRKTGDYRICIENPRLVICGATVDETFAKGMKLESLLDGFSQRFLYVLATADKRKKFFDYLDYNRGQIIGGLKEYFDSIKEILPEKEPGAEFIEYQLIPKFLDIIKDELRLAFRKYDKIPESFLRRIYYSIYKYSLIYHFILLKHNNLIDEEDLRYSSKCAILHVKWLKDVLDMLGFDSVNRDIKNIDKAVQKLSDKKVPVNINTITRYLVQNHKTFYGDAESTRRIVTALYIESLPESAKAKKPKLRVM
jgi:hypothetical protein